MRNVLTTFKPWYEYETYKGFEVEWLMTLIGEGYDETISDWEKECAEDFRDILRYTEGHSTKREKNFHTFDGFDTEWLDILSEEGFDETISHNEVTATQNWQQMKGYAECLDENKKSHDVDPYLVARAKLLYKKHSGSVSKMREEYPKKLKKAGYYDDYGKREVNNEHGKKQRSTNTVSFHVGKGEGKTSNAKLHIYDSGDEKRVYITSHDSEEEHTKNRKKRSEKL